MTTPPMEPNLSDTTSVAKPVKAGPPRALLLGGVVLGLAGAAAAGFYFLNPANNAEDVATDTPVAPVQQAPAPPVPRPTAPVPAAKPAVDPSKAQAAQALGAFPGRIRLDTSFDNVPTSLGGDGKRVFPAASTPVANNAGKAKPIIQGKLPSGRVDPFVSRLIVPLTREFAYTLAVPIRLAPPA
ncbi:MAG: hypothetical protein H8F28_11870, partial [Fibrella sp.]|nr:hypothetical protein [Armatimonadota bacterium]